MTSSEFSKNWGILTCNMILVSGTQRVCVYVCMCVCVCVCVHARAHARAKLLQSCLTLRDPMDCSPPGSSVHGILQAKKLECVAIPPSRGSFGSRDRTPVSCTAGRFFTIWAIREALVSFGSCLIPELDSLGFPSVPSWSKYPVT